MQIFFFRKSLPAYALPAYAMDAQIGGVSREKGVKVSYISLDTLKSP